VLAIEIQTRRPRTASDELHFSAMLGRGMWSGIGSRKVRAGTAHGSTRCVGNNDIGSVNSIKLLDS
jgi:hypothetical protein